jgi:hypothetical protein
MKTAYNVRVDRTVRGDIGVDRTWEGVNRTVEGKLYFCPPTHFFVKKKRKKKKKNRGITKSKL